MAVVTRRFERKDKTATALHARWQRLAGFASVLLIAIAAVHFLHRIGVDGVARWDVLGRLLGFTG